MKSTLLLLGALVAMVSSLSIDDVVIGIAGLPCPQGSLCMNANECKAASGQVGNFCSFGNVCCKPLSCPRKGNGFCVNKASCKTGRYTKGLCPGDNSIRCCTATISDKGFKIIKDNLQFFKFLHVQTDAEFIGYSHRCTQAGECAKLPDPITEDIASNLLKEDIKPLERCVTALVNAELNDDQYSALISFVFSSGCSAFQKTDILALINQNKLAEAGKLFCSYTKTADGRQLGSLVTRRGIEASLFTGTTTSCLTAN